MSYLLPVIIYGLENYDYFTFYSLGYIIFSKFPKFTHIYMNIMYMLHEC